MLAMYNAAPAPGTTRMHKLMLHSRLCEQVDVPDKLTDEAMKLGFAPETCDQVGYTKEEGARDVKAPDGKTYEVSAWVKGGAEALPGVPTGMTTVAGLPLQQLYGSSHSYLQNLYGSSHSYLQNLYGSSHSYLQNMATYEVVHGLYSGYCLQSQIPSTLVPQVGDIAQPGPCSSAGYTQEQHISKTVQTKFGNFQAVVYTRPTMLIWDG